MKRRVFGVPVPGALLVTGVVVLWLVVVLTLWESAGCSTSMPC